MLFRSSRPSPNHGYPFWLLALTFRSSRPAYGGRLTSPVSPFTTYTAVLEEKFMTIHQAIRELAQDYSNRLLAAIDARTEEMLADDVSHYLIYRVLGISHHEGQQIDLYQNKGRFLYKYAGSFLEQATKKCFEYAFPDSGSIRVPNTRGQRPRTFEIDCLVGNDALEIKWKDATTDGDHITKEHTRIQVIADASYTPIRVMFYYPNRQQAMRIQQTLETLYQGIGGHYYYGDGAWAYVQERTGVNLKDILVQIANERVPNDAQA